MDYKPLPVGVDNFEHLISRGYYFVDKTWFIKELLDKKSSVNLFTRPRWFGKTLNMSMLQYYFEDMHTEDGKKRDNASLFDNKKILQYMLVEKCKHVYRDNEHWMDLTLRGGDFCV